MIDYSITPVAPDRMRSVTVRSVAHVVSGMISQAFTVNADPDARHLADVIIFENPADPTDHTAMIQGDGDPHFSTITTEAGQGPTDDDIDDVIGDWMVAREIGLEGIDPPTVYVPGYGWEHI